MANRQNSFAALLAALTLAPQFVHDARKTDATNEERHSNVANALAAAAQVGGAIAAMQNPLYAGLINAAVQAAVASAHETDWAPPPPVVMVPTPITDVTAAASGGTPVGGAFG